MPNHISSGNLWLVGAGNMAYQYGKVLNAIGADYRIVGNGYENARAYRRNSIETFITVALRNISIPIHLFQITPLSQPTIQTLAKICTQLCQCGVAHILVEKPGGLNGPE